MLAGDLLGIYLYGSAVSGGFDADASDVDLVAVTAPEIDAIDLAGLAAMHRRLVDRFPAWDDRIEVVYVSRQTLAAFRTSAGQLAVISPGEPFHVRGDPPLAWLQNWYLVRETGVPLDGPDPAGLIPAIAWSEFEAATRGYVDELRHRASAGTSAGAIAYTVLTLCRAQATVALGRPVSKQEGAAWVRARMPEWAGLVDMALACRLARGRTGFADDRSRAAAEAFIAGGDAPSG